MSDAEQLALIQRFLAAPRETVEPPAFYAWMDFYLEHDAAIQAIIRCRHRRQEDIDDIHQDIWYILVRRLPSLVLDPDRGTLRAWIIRIARNQAGWCLSREMPRQETTLTPELGNQLLDPGAGPVSECDRKERQDRVRAIVMAVCARLRAPNDRILLMHWIGEQPPRVIATELGLTENQVRAVIRRSVPKLSDALVCNGFQDTSGKVVKDQGFTDHFQSPATIDSSESAVTGDRILLAVLICLNIVELT